MWMLLLIAFGILRLVVPPYVLLSPVAISVLATFLDAADGYIAFRAGLTHHAYHIYDKLLDYWWYIFILLYSVDLPIFPVMFILFVYRTAGQITSLTLGNGVSFLWFPNILENYFFGFLIAKILPILAPLYEGRLQIATLIVCAIIAVGREYIIHIRKLTIANYFLNTNMHWEFNEPKKKRR